MPGHKWHAITCACPCTYHTQFKYATIACLSLKNWPFRHVILRCVAIVLVIVTKSKITSAKLIHISLENGKSNWLISMFPQS